MKLNRPHFARPHRSGVALLTVLMTLVLVSSIAVVTRAQSGAGMSALERDIAVIGARWRAEGCVARVIATADDAVRMRRDTAWNELDLELSNLTTLLRSSRCEMVVESAGHARDVNRTDSVSLATVLRAAGVAGERTDSLVAALLDWTDADRIPRAAGAEDEWYVAHRRRTPRNSALRAMEELELVRGFDAPRFMMDTIAPLLTADSVRVDLVHASLPVLLSFTSVPDAVVREWWRARLARQPGELLRATGFEAAGLGVHAIAAPDGWVITVRTQESARATTSVEQRVRLARGSDRVGVIAVAESR